MSCTLQDVLARELPTLEAREGTGITGAVKVSMNDGTINGRFKKMKTGLIEDGSGPQCSSQWSKRRWQHHWNTPMVIAIDSQRSLQVTKFGSLRCQGSLDCGEIEEPEDGPACTGTDDSATKVDFSPEEICEASNSYCIINCYFIEREVVMG